MKCCSVQMSVLLLTVGGWCVSLHDQATREALPKVACLRRRIQAVFGPLVQTNLQVKGKHNRFTHKQDVVKSRD